MHQPDPAHTSGARFEPSALRAHRLFASPDLDEARACISRVLQPHGLLPLSADGQRPHTHMDFAHIGTLGLGTIDFGAAMRVEVDRVQDYHLVMFCLRGYAEVRTADRLVQVNPSRGVICAPGSTFIAELSTDCEQFVLRLDRQALEGHCGRAITFEPVLDLERPELQAWLAQLHLLGTSPTLMHNAQHNPLVGVGLEQVLVQLLLANQSWTDAASGRRDHTAHRAPAAGCVRRAEAYIEEHADAPLRLADIADAAGVPVRTLLDAFQRFRDRTPMQALREVRLRRARALLQAGEPGTRVSTVALDCGFAHLGRFAQDYQRRFGEAPSATLARSY